MRLAELVAPRTFRVVDVPVPVPAADEVLVRVAACGLCSSEHSTWDGTAAVPLPARIGHEVTGVVVAVGSGVTGVRRDDPVAVWTTTSGYAEYVAVPASWCWPAGDVPLDQALAEPLACAVNAVELADVRLGDDVVVIGAGFMGNLVQQLAALRGVRHLVVADTRPDALALAALTGSTRTVNTREESLADVVHGLTGGTGADVTFEVTGAQGALDLVADVTRMSGKVAFVGYHQGAPREVPLGTWNWMAFQLINAHFRDEPTIMRGMAVGMRLLTAGRIRMDRLVTHRYPLEAINEAFVEATAKPEGFVKAVITFDTEPPAAP